MRSETPHTAMARPADEGGGVPARATPRWLHIVNIVVYLAAIATIVVVINFFAGRAEYRAQIDATKTRAYSLSEQSQKMLSGLQGKWTIALIVSDANVNRAMRKQIDEVLRRYTDASPDIRVLKIDPDNPRTLSDYESLLRDLQALYKDDIAKYDTALDAGTETFKQFRTFAQQHAIEVVAAASALPENDQSRKRLEQSAGALQRIADQGEEVFNAIEKARRITENQPIPDYEGARSILATALTSYANETDGVSTILAGWSKRSDIGQPEKAFAAIATKTFQDESLRLAAAADPLKQLPALELGDFGRQLGLGEAAIILSPTRAAIIPSNQLFPKSNLTSTRDGGVTFDQRFRGEQLLSAAIRSLTLEQMPRIVFVHAEQGSLLTRQKDQADLTGVAAMLKASRYDVAEWNVGKSPVRPESSKPNQKTVWVIVPPPPASSIEPTLPARAIFDAADKLLLDGENVLLSVYPSLLAKYGQPDPLAALSAPFGIKPDTSTIVYEQSPAGEGQNTVSANQLVQGFSEETAIGRAVEGQAAIFAAPVPLLRMTAETGAPPGDSVTIRTIAAIEPKPTLWLETDWTGDLTTRDPRPDQRVSEAVPIALTAERANPSGVGEQRVIVVGSGGWMVTNAADRVVDIGGGRVALVYPGNHELMLASVAWLAGLDDLIAASPMSQEVSRLRGITPEVRAVWWWIIVAGVPAMCLLLGAAVWLWRKM